MMTDTPIHELALDTLYGRRIGPPGRSVRTNLAGIELAQSSAEAIPVIERVIASEVLPTLSNTQRQTPNTPFAPIEYGSMVGLNYLLGSYLVISVRNSLPGMIAFVFGLPAQLVYEAVNCASTFFYKTSDGYNFGVSPNQLLLRFVQQAESSAIPEISAAAKKVRSQLDS